MASNTPDPTGVPPSSTAGIDNPALRPLVAFATIALLVGWVLLTPPVVLGLPMEPFVLATTLFGLVLPAVLLSRREPERGGARALLRDAVRIPRPLVWGPLAVLVIPVLLWSAAAVAGGAEPLTGSLILDFTILFLSSALIINIWEEMAWTGFAQRRAMARWGLAQGSLVTAMLFAAIHFPLVFNDVDGAQDVLAGIGILFGTGIGLRLLIAGLDPWSGRSLLTIGLLHGSFNASSSLVDPSYDWMRYVITIALGLATLAVLRRSVARDQRDEVPRRR